LSVSAGHDVLAYGFSGEWTDDSRLIYLRARDYMPSTGIFTSKDPSKGSELVPYSQHPWVYVLANPLRYTDPAGTCLDVDVDGICDFEVDRSPVEYYSEVEAPLSDPTGMYPTRRPSNIHWNPSVSVVPPELRDATGEVVRIGTFQAQFKITAPEGSIDYGEDITGACGILSSAAVVGRSANEVFEDAYDAVWYWEDAEGTEWPVYVTPNYTSHKELEAVIELYPGWHAYTRRGIPLSQADVFLRGVLIAGSYAIPGVAISGYSGKIGQGTAAHWVVISGMSEEWDLGPEWQWVRIYNPFNHQEEYYMWELFLDNWGRGAEWSGTQDPSGRQRIAVVAYYRSRPDYPLTGYIPE
jgi:RHS repeat-associated protein